MSDDLLVNAAAASALAGLMLYAVLGGADFGGGVWDLFAGGPRRARQREAIARARGPRREANTVRLIFVIVVPFTCFPYGYSHLGVALFVPFHLALAGIMLRGAAFVFRAHARHAKGHQASPADQFGAVWGSVFGVAST